jgi:hypothetical protein
VVRAIAAGEHELAVKVAGYHLRMERMIVKALRGGAAAAEPTARESAVASTLNRVWFASLVGWAGGLHSVREVTDRMRETAELLEPA